MIKHTICILTLSIFFNWGSAQDISRKGGKPGSGNFSENSLYVSPMSAGVTAQQMVENLLGLGVTFSNVQYTGAQVASGLFAGGTAAGINIEEGVILSCGAAEFAIGPNNLSNASQVNNLPGDSDLNNLGYSTNDASVLEFDFIPELDYISFNFVMGSEEYPEYISGYPDVFAFFLDGENIALIPGTLTPISIGTVNHLQNSQYYISNSDSPPLYDVQCDGFTIVFELVATVTPNITHHIKMTVADVNDHSLDTWIFLEGGSFVSANPGITVEPITLNESLCPAATSDQYFSITNDGTGELTFTINDNVSWLSFSPLSGSVLEGQSIQIETVFDASGLVPGNYQSNIEITNNTPQNPITISASLEVFSSSTNVFIDQDNENNLFEGAPDNDFDEFLCKGDEKLPIEFSFIIGSDVVESATLSVSTYDVDVVPNSGLPYPQEDRVFINGNYLGLLNGGDQVESLTEFNIPGSYLIPGPNGKNIIQIFVSAKGKYWCLQMNSAEIIIQNCIEK